MWRLSHAVLGQRKGGSKSTNPGLYNSGSNCYINAILQAFAAVPTFATYTAELAASGDPTAAILYGAFVPRHFAISTPMSCFMRLPRCVVPNTHRSILRMLFKLTSCANQ